MIMLMVQPESPGVFKWVAFGNTTAISSLQETVEDYLSGLLSAGVSTGLTFTYDDAANHMDVAIAYGAVGDIAAVGALTSSGAAGAVAGKAANAGHVHPMVSHPHTGGTDGGTVAHTALTAIGTKTHATIDSHIDASGATVHGLGTMATQNAASVAITGGTITGVAMTGVTDLTVPDGGTGLSTITDHGIMLGSGTAAITVTAEPTDGQLLIGKTGFDPVLGSLAAGTGITVTPGAGTLTVAADLKTNGGLVIETNDLAVDLSASAITGTLGVADGGTGAQTLTSHGLILGNGVGAVAILAEATNGQIPIGATGANPTLALPTGSEGITVTGASGALAFKVTDDGVTLAKMASGASRGILHYVDGTFDPALLAAPAIGEVLVSGGATTNLAFGKLAPTSMANGSAWAAYVPALTWLNGVPPASVTTVARWIRAWNNAWVELDISGPDGDGALLHGITLPVISASTVSSPFAGFAVVNTTGSAIFGHFLTPAEVALDSTVGDRVGATVIADGNMGAETAWTLAANWDIELTGVATHTTGTADNLVNDDWSPTIGCKYRLVYTIASVTTPGTLAVSCGGITLTPRTTAATFSEDFIATGTDKLTFAADATFAGTLDNAAVYQLIRGGSATESGIKLHTPVTCADAVAWRVRLAGMYEIA
jgi:hypothetical protein